MIAKTVQPCLKSTLGDTPRTTPQQHSHKIRALNDALRISGKGGRVMFTDGIIGHGLDFAAQVMKAVTSFDDFNPDNNPWNEHDCATVNVSSQTVIWKIDYYDRELTYHSPDPADPAVTCRVLTIMLAEEY
jgi:hypothetical protein